jgi:AcrR family transcriptional regulator
VTTIEPRAPGRPRQFDEETVLDRVTEVFWEQGYANTSVADLVEATGVHKPSLYRTFGSKDELFALVLRRYVVARMGALTERVESTAPGTEGIRQFLAAIRDDLVDGVAGRGCLLVASSSELRGTTPGFENFGAVYREAIRDVLRPLVARAGGSSAEVDDRTNVMATWMLGLDVTTRGGATAVELDQAIDAMAHVVDTWT